MNGPRWYLLVHHLPQEPFYLRAKVRKRLVRFGAVALKRSVYVLPRREDLLEALRRIAREIAGGGGAADVFEADSVGPRTNEEIEDLFRRERDLEYAALTKELRRTSSARGELSAGATRLHLARARKRLGAIVRRDYFEAHGRRDVEATLAKRDAAMADAPPHVRGGAHADLLDRTWVTRRGIQVDRIACAWFIRRFIDPKARLRFIDSDAGEVRAGELRYDMADGDFTHEDDRCSFETLIRRTGMKDRALGLVAEIVHEIDIKDGKYERPETGGVRHLLQGLILANAEDSIRLARGSALFDDLYDSFRRQLGLASEPAPHQGRARGSRPDKGGSA